MSGWTLANDDRRTSRLLVPGDFSSRNGTHRCYRVGLVSFARLHESGFLDSLRRYRLYKLIRDLCADYASQTFSRESRREEYIDILCVITSEL